MIAHPKVNGGKAHGSALVGGACNVPKLRVGNNAADGPVRGVLVVEPRAGFRNKPRRLLAEIGLNVEPNAQGERYAPAPYGKRVRGVYRDGNRKVIV